MSHQVYDDCLVAAADIANRYEGTARYTHVNVAAFALGFADAAPQLLRAIVGNTVADTASSYLDALIGDRCTPHPRRAPPAAPAP